MAPGDFSKSPHWLNWKELSREQREVEGESGEVMQRSKPQDPGRAVLLEILHETLKHEILSHSTLR